MTSKKGCQSAVELFDDAFDFFRSDLLSLAGQTLEILQAREELLGRSAWSVSHAFPLGQGVQKLLIDIVERASAGQCTVRHVSR